MLVSGSFSMDWRIMNTSTFSLCRLGMVTLNILLLVSFPLLSSPDVGAELKMQVMIR